MQNQQEEEEEDDCAICNESLPKLSSNLTRMTCCGKGTHKKCHDNIYKSSMSDEQKSRCIMCRTKHAATGSKEEIDQLRHWVEKGKAWAQCMLGQKYDIGEGVEQSDQQAKELFELAASQGDAGAQYTLGVMYYKGQGVDQIYEKAAEYYEAAAMQGLAEAQFNLGIVYYNGQGVEQSIETACEWWMKAAAKLARSSIDIPEEEEEEVICLLK
jgi:TPR repeat protein